MEEQPNIESAEPPVLPESDLEAVLEEYRRRQMVEHLTGPVVSVVLHLIVLVICFIFMVEKPTPPVLGVEFKSTVVDVKTIDKLDQKIEKQIEKMDEVVPPVERPDVTEAATPTATSTVSDFTDDMPANDNVATSVLDVKMSNSPIRIAGIYAGRSGKGRSGALGKFGSAGGGPSGTATELAVLKALRWLKEHQSPDGSWSKSRPVAMCGLALLCYLAHGELANSKEFGTTVEKAMKYLANCMNAVKDGKLIAGSDPNGYSHAIAVYALAEAYGMTKNPLLKEPMEKGLAIMVNGQQPNGGWDYKFAKESTRWDLSISGWTIQALKAGFLAGSENAKLGEALQKAATFVQKTTYKNARFGYSAPGSGSLAMTGVGTLCLQLLGQKDCEEAKAGVQTIKDKVTVLWRDLDRKTSTHVSFEPYGWYYQTQVMFYNGMSTWPSWNRMFSTELLKGQNADGHWDAPPVAGGGKSAVGEEMEPYYATTLNCLMLEVYYRFLPSYKMDLKETHSDGPAKLELE